MDNKAAQEEWLGKYLRHLAHDLIGPSRNMQGFAQLIGKHTANLGNETLTNYVRLLNEEAKRNYDMLTAAQNYGRLMSQPVTPVPVDVIELGKTLWEKENPDPKATITFPQRTAIVDIDKTHARQLLNELFANACRFVREGESPVLKMEFSCEQGRVQFMLTDNGIGIAPEFHNHVRMLYTRLYPERYPGIGAGLAYCDAILQRCGGTLSFDIPKTGGTRVTCNFKESEYKSTS